METSLLLAPSAYSDLQMVLAALMRKKRSLPGGKQNNLWFRRKMMTP